MFRSSNDKTYVIPKEVGAGVNVEYFGCEYCSEGGWTSETEVEIHKAVSHNEKIFNLLNKNEYYCRICIKNCQNADGLLRHVKTSHLLSSDNAYRVEREIFVCDKCEQIFFNKLLLSVHIAHVHSKDLRNSQKIECPICAKSVRVKTIWFHFQGHSLQSVASCPICLAKCVNRKHLMRHLKNHQRFFKCEMCSYETKRDELYRQHIFSRHKRIILDRDEVDVSLYFIPLVEQTWKYNIRYSGLKGLELTNGVRICIMCREICVGEAKMRNHILVEHNIKDERKKKVYACTCGEQFNIIVLLKHHIFKLEGDHKMVEESPQQQ